MYCDLIVLIFAFKLLLIAALVISSSAFPGSVQNPKCVHASDLKYKGAGLISDGLGLFTIFGFWLFQDHLGCSSKNHLCRLLYHKKINRNTLIPGGEYILTNEP